MRNSLAKAGLQVNASRFLGDPGNLLTVTFKMAERMHNIGTKALGVAFGGSAAKGAEGAEGAEASTKVQTEHFVKLPPLVMPVRGLQASSRWASTFRPQPPAA